MFDIVPSYSLVECPERARRVKGACGVASRSASLTLDTAVPSWGSAATRRMGAVQETDRAGRASGRPGGVIVVPLACH